MPLQEPYRTRIAARLQRLYTDQAAAVLPRLEALVDRFCAGDLPAERNAAEQPKLWDERTAILITYGDQLQTPWRPALQVLMDFVGEHGLDQLFSGIHILPFCPYSSDDGFSVIDYRRVNPALGDWDDLERLAGMLDLMADFVVNHCSREHTWFQAFLRGEAPYTNYFLDVDPATDLSAVTRPRSSPLLTPFETSRGTRHVWTTFSADQVDLNFSEPAVLLDMLDILLSYVRRGARIIRLDAIGFLWKLAGTSCMHLPQTHEVVKLMRDLLDAVRPGTLLITETNVPHAENVSYFGQGDEAHAVYQFSLAPLLLDALLTGDAAALSGWLRELEPPPAGCTFFNFTASHDGIGVRPLEGLVSDERFEALVEGIRRRGGLVSMRRRPDGTESPYELNCTYLSAVDSPEGLPQPVLIRRFLTSQAVMLALKGIPGVYFHSLVGTRNDLAGVQQTGHYRSINRPKYDLEKMRQLLADKGALSPMVFDGYRRLLRVRTSQPAFHPDAGQRVVDAGHPGVLAFVRGEGWSERPILVLASMVGSPLRIHLDRCLGERPREDLLSGRPVRGAEFELGGYDTAWLI